MCPVRENTLNMNQEAAVAAIINERSTKAYPLAKCPKYHPADYIYRILETGKTFHLEIKVRDMKWGTYDDIFISANKIAALGQFIPLGIGMKLVIVTRDIMGVWACEDLSEVQEFRKSLSGRYDRGDKSDEEIMVHIPHDKFVQLELTEAELDSVWGSLI